ncbi:uncharacterized protein TRUGW13939_02206 [Talaromyces rugulosus]|uniref:Uncharacterized protein n=1 Tax=Talaromyces rugulosus TaxID=121627 RepID=A0A7H8QMK1_TALRU|nr:uncharacterized protein TRUGW13939_02206 [Talaromyces rugulosus]QKX55114.1 hypothetical protein TRUGW13939_02206 [Talaromyces rugulosus]
MSTLEEVLLTRHRLSEYHVYREHAGKGHICITPFSDITKEPGYKKKKKSKTELEHEPEYNSIHHKLDTNNSYFIHRPLITSWHDPPRTLRRGDTRAGEPVCIINSAACWKEWNIQFTPDLKHIIDPRGLVRWENRSRPDNSTAHDDHAIRGFKVRSWRSWGETGKEYHRQVNARRKAALHEQGQKDEEEEHYEPVAADEAVHLTWSSPFSLKSTRRYEFEYAGIQFFWEGTSDVPLQTPSDKWSRRLMPFNHLKLMARSTRQEKLFVGQYVCSLSPMKYGRLWIFDSVIQDLLEESREKLDPDFDVRKTRVYDLVMATAMCMIIGEWQKRMTVQLIFIILLQGAGVTYSS